MASTNKIRKGVPGQARQKPVMCHTPGHGVSHFLEFALIMSDGFAETHEISPKLHHVVSQTIEKLFRA